jgi:hypothetical protein
MEKPTVKIAVSPGDFRRLVRGEKVVYTQDEVRVELIFSGITTKVIFDFTTK